MTLAGCIRRRRTHGMIAVVLQCDTDEVRLLRAARGRHGSVSTPMRVMRSLQSLQRSSLVLRIPRVHLVIHRRGIRYCVDVVGRSFRP